MVGVEFSIGKLTDIKVPRRRNGSFSSISADRGGTEKRFSGISGYMSDDDEEHTAPRRLSIYMR